MPTDPDEVRRLLDYADMMDTETRKVVHASLLMDWAAALREARDEYLADLQMLRERGHHFDPDPEAMADVDAEITLIQQIAASLDEGEER